MENILLKAIEILLGNPVTVTLIITGVACIIIAIFGEIPGVRTRRPFSAIQVIILGLFGLLLIVVSVTLSWILAVSPSEQISMTPAITNMPEVLATPSSSSTEALTGVEPTTSAITNTPEVLDTVTVQISPIAITPTIPEMVAEPTKIVGKYPCPLTISASEVETWKVGQTSVQAVQEAVARFDARRPYNEGMFVAGTEIPAGVLVATNYDESDGTAWTNYPVIPIIHSGTYGLFQTIGEYTVPNTGACITIVP